MRTVWKFPFPVQGSFTLQVPGKDAPILLAECQDGEPCLWIEVDSDEAPSERHFRLFGTGHLIPPDKQLVHRGSFQKGLFVWHLYEIGG